MNENDIHRINRVADLWFEQRAIMVSMPHLFRPGTRARWRQRCITVATWIALIVLDVSFVWFFLNALADDVR